MSQQRHFNSWLSTRQKSKHIHFGEDVFLFISPGQCSLLVRDVHCASRIMAARRAMDYLLSSIHDRTFISERNTIDRDFVRLDVEVLSCTNDRTESGKLGTEKHT